MSAIVARHGSRLLTWINSIIVELRRLNQIKERGEAS
jgi:hypothetical protein